MAILSMKKLAIVGVNSELEQVLDSLQRMEEVEIDSFYKDDEIKKFDEKEFIEKSEKVKRNLKTVEEAEEILKIYSKDIKEPFMLEGRKLLDSHEYSTYYEEGYDETLSLANAIVDNYRSVKEKEANIEKLNLKIESLYPWKNLDIPLNMKGTDSTSIFIGTFPQELSKLDIENQILQNLANAENKDMPSDIPFEVEVLSKIQTYTYVVIFCLNTHKDIIYEAIRKIGFSYPSIQSNTTCKDEIDEINKEIKSYENEIKNLEDKIKSQSTSIEKLRFLEDYEALRIGKYEKMNDTYKLGNVFMITGYIPSMNFENFRNNLTQKYNLFIEAEDCERSNDVPVKMHNNAYSEPLESTICGYSPPGENDIDPTFTVSIFYYFLFGMMFSDAGYGLLMVLGCGLGLIKYKDTIEREWKNNLKMFFMAGAFTMFWGIMFGSFFGDAVAVISSTFFSGNATLKPLWFDPVSNPMRLLLYSLIIGIIHLFTGHTLKGYVAIKNKDIKTLVYDVLSWYGLLISLLIIMINMDMIKGIFHYDIKVPTNVLQICKYVAIVCSVVIVLMSARDIKNPAGRIGTGVYDLYGVTGWLSDVLSYARLLALGLATGVIGTVINMMAAMVAKGNGIIGAIFFIIILVAGHGLNFGINVLGAYVHTNRLQYVEYFGKFYEGGGKLFTPFSMNTKYYKFKEN